MIPAAKTIAFFCSIAIACCSVAFAQHRPENRIAESVKILEHVAKTNRFKAKEYEPEYWGCLLLTKRFDKAFETINHEKGFYQRGLIASYCQAMQDSGKSLELIGDIEKLEKFVDAEHERRAIRSAASDARKVLDRYLGQSKIIKAVNDEEFAIALEQFNELQERRLLEWRMESEKQAEAAEADGSAEFFDSELDSELLIHSKNEVIEKLFKFHGTLVETISQTKSEKVAKAWIEYFVATLPEKDESVQESEDSEMNMLSAVPIAVDRDAQRKRLLNYLPRPEKPRLTFKEMNEKGYKEKRLEIEAIDKTTKPQEWLNCVVDAIQYNGLSATGKLEYFKKAKILFADATLDEEQVHEFQWRLYRRYVENGDWDELLQILDLHDPDENETFAYREILSEVVAKVPDRLGEFVERVPDWDERFRYDRYLLNLLLHHGYQQKAEKNLESVEDKFHYNEWKVAFYQVLHAAEFKDVEKMAAAYAAVTPESEFNYFYKCFLGDDHLAMVAVRGGPEVALDLARRVPESMSKFHRGSDVGRCMSALIRRGKLDLAIEVFHLATKDEQAATYLNTEGLFGERDLYSNFSPDDCWKLEEVLPNNPKVVRARFSQALDSKNKQQALELARRSLQRTKRCRHCSRFVALGWETELLELAQEIQKQNAENRRYQRVAENVARDVAFSIKFEGAAEAIEFAKKYFRSMRSRKDFLLGLARDWARD